MTARWTHHGASTAVTAEVQPDQLERRVASDRRSKRRKFIRFREELIAAR
jgi:hypothetical protein